MTVFRGRFPHFKMVFEGCFMSSREVGMSDDFWGVLA